MPLQWCMLAVHTLQAPNSRQGLVYTQLVPDLESYRWLPHPSSCAGNMGVRDSTKQTAVPEVQEPALWRCT